MQASMFKALADTIEGEVLCDKGTLLQYATDASVYRKIPLGVVLPKNAEDIATIVKFAREHKLSIIPRTAGTSLAGQCVGEGLVMDLSRYMNSILQLNREENWVDVEPGVIRDELNAFLRADGLFFGPNTSTANRCMLGGMLGNNSCGTTSIKYGSTRDKVIEVEAVLSDGSVALFNDQGESYVKESSDENLAGRIHRTMVDLLEPLEVRDEIREKFPHPAIHRRNTGYALDAIIDQKPFEKGGDSLNLAKLIAGSEGTLCIATRIRLKLDPLPPPMEAVVCAHFQSVVEAMEATVLAMKKSPFACEVMDKTILDLSKGNAEQMENRFFVEGDPGAILCIELRSLTEADLKKQCDDLIKDFQDAGLGYAFPIVFAPDTARVWTLRAAGLGVLSNMKGDAKPVAFVEDTAVSLSDLPRYIAEFEEMMNDFGQKAIYYAHAGAGELHLRPVLNLKSPKGRKDFRAIGEASARLVKKFNGSLSGEHGDGRVRGEFIQMMVGEKNYELMRKVKTLWDPQNIFNPGKIVNADPMDADFRYEENQRPFTFETFLDFSEDGTLLSTAEKCNGSGDCRKLPSTGATMCPSYHASRNEKDTTRARANVLREVLSRPENPAFPFDSEEMHEVLDLCLSCKACRRECPSTVDMSLMKAEVNYRYYQRNGIPRRNRFFGNFHKSASFASVAPGITNAFLRIPAIDRLIKKRFGIAEERSLPAFSGRRASGRIKGTKKSYQLILYVDEFSEFQDAHVVKAAAEVLKKLNYRFRVIYAPSGRALLSKSMLPEAKKCAENMLEKLKPALENRIPIVGLEPSAILGLRDDLPKLLRGDAQEKMKELGQLSMTFEEYLAREMDAGAISADLFTDEAQEIHVHLHCHQKALSHISHSMRVLSFPKNYRAQKIPSGCCGMAGSFGYEKEHYEVSMKIGEQILFPHIRKTSPEVLVAAAGTSCRHQIKDGVGRVALHPAEILLKALKK